jgi:hypothetical protein
MTKANAKRSKPRRGRMLLVATAGAAGVLGLGSACRCGPEGISYCILTDGGLCDPAEDPTSGPFGKSFSDGGPPDAGGPFGRQIPDGGDGG